MATPALPAKKVIWSEMSSFLPLCSQPPPPFSQQHLQWGTQSNPSLVGCRQIQESLHKATRASHSLRDVREAGEIA